MEFYELIQAVHALDQKAFVERFAHPFLLEDDPEETRPTLETTQEEMLQRERDLAASRRVFPVVRRDGKDGPIVIGRASQADVRLEHGTISSRHAQLKKVPGTWMLTDLHSTNGTRIGDSPAPAGVALPVRPGSKLRFGPDLSFTFFEAARIHHILKLLAPSILDSIKPGAVPSEGTSTFQTARARRDAGEASRERPRPQPGACLAGLVARCDPLAPVTLEVGKEVRVGRTDENDIVLPHPAVSRRHATLTRDGDVVLVRDLASSNGTFLGEQRVREVAFALPGDAPILIGPFEIRIEARSEAPLVPPRPAETTALRRDRLEGTLETMPLADMLQAAELNHRSGTIRIEDASGKAGEIAFAEGRPLRASFGTERGEAAVLALLGLRKGNFTYVPGAPAEGTGALESSFMKLLMEASRLADESHT